MAWPKRGTRKLIIDGIEWLYHYDAHCEFCSADSVTVGQLGQPHYLFLDTFSRHFDNTPRHACDSIRWATANGWSPAWGPDRALSATESGFEWLPHGYRHFTDNPQRPLDCPPHFTFTRA